MGDRFAALPTCEQQQASPGKTPGKAAIRVMDHVAGSHDFEAFPMPIERADPHEGTELIQTDGARHSGTRTNVHRHDRASTKLGSLRAIRCVC